VIAYVKKKKKNDATTAGLNKNKWVAEFIFISLWFYLKHIRFILFLLFNILSSHTILKFLNRHLQNDMYVSTYDSLVGIATLKLC